MYRLRLLNGTPKVDGENHSNNFVVCKHAHGVLNIWCAIHTLVLTVYHLAGSAGF